MARLARVVVPGTPHHVTQRGNRGQRIFFRDADYRLYIELVAAAAHKARAQIWAYALLPTQVHLIVVPRDADGLRATFADAHRRYTAAINLQHKWTGHLFQGRFGAVAMDEAHALAAARLMAHAPVKARLADAPEDWPWSSVPAHLKGRDDALVSVKPLRERAGRMKPFFAAQPDPDDVRALEKAATVGRPLGAPKWLAALERRLGRTLAPAKRGPKPGAKRKVK